MMEEERGRRDVLNFTFFSSWKGALFAKVGVDMEEKKYNLQKGPFFLTVPLYRGFLGSFFLFST